MNQKFMTKTCFYEFLQDEGISLFLNLDKPAPFTVETAFLDHWNVERDGAPDLEGINVKSDINHSESQACLFIACDNREDIGTLIFVFTPSAESGKYGLTIIDDDNVVYERTAEQDEATEWQINCMADDPEITDENGNPLFVGEPIQE